MRNGAFSTSQAGQSEKKVALPEPTHVLKVAVSKACTQYTMVPLDGYMFATE